MSKLIKFKIYPIKSRKKINLGTVHKFYFVLGQKIFGPKRSYYWKYGLWELEGWGSTHQVQGMDSYPVDKMYMKKTI